MYMYQEQIKKQITIKKADERNDEMTPLSQKKGVSVAEQLRYLILPFDQG